MNNKPSEMEGNSNSTQTSSSSDNEPKKSLPKRQRSKSLSKGSGLEAVNENDELVTGTSPARHESCPAYFGVKSYLHNFYESVSIKDPHLYEEYEEYRYLIEPKERRRTLLFWRFVFWTGFILLILGALILLAGYLVPRMDIDVGYQEEMRIIDRRAYLLNQRLDWCKVIGLAVFCVGGTLLSASLILPSLTGLSCIDDDNGDEEHQPFKLRIVDDDENVNNDDEKIPATEQVKSIQPKREDEMVITKTGLTKVE